MQLMVRILMFIIAVIIFISFAAIMIGILGNNFRKNRAARKMKENSKNAR